jgi:hypothetical protein
LRPTGASFVDDGIESAIPADLRSCDSAGVAQLLQAVLHGAARRILDVEADNAPAERIRLYSAHQLEQGNCLRPERASGSAALHFGFLRLPLIARAWRLLP